MMMIEWGTKRLQDIVTSTKLKFPSSALDKVDFSLQAKTALEMELTQGLLAVNLSWSNCHYAYSCMCENKGRNQGHVEGSS